MASDICIALCYFLAFQCNVVVAPGGGPSCEFVRYCINCTYTGGISQGYILTTDENNCYNTLREDTRVQAAEYLANGTCYMYKTGRLSFAEGHVTYARTCFSDCLNSSLVLYRYKTLSALSAGGVIMAYTLDSCVENIIQYTLSSVVAWNDDTFQCKLSSGCSTNCSLQSDSTSTVVVQNCNATRTTTIHTTTPSTTGPTSTTTTSATGPTSTTTTPSTTGPTTTTTPSTSGTTTTTTSSTTGTTRTTTPSTTGTTISKTTSTPGPTNLTTTTNEKATTPTKNAVTNTKRAKTTFQSLQRIYIMPCICYKVKEWINLTSAEIIDNLVKNLTIDRSNTTKAQGKLISRSDARGSSTYIGRFACAVLIGLLGVIVSFDCRRLCKILKDRRLMKRIATSKVPPRNAKR